MNYGRRFMTLYRRQGSRPSPWKRNAKSKVAVQGELTNSCEKKRTGKLRRKGKIFPFECISGTVISQRSRTTRSILENFLGASNRANFLMKLKTEQRRRKI